MPKKPFLIDEIISQLVIALRSPVDKSKDIPKLNPKCPVHDKDKNKRDKSDSTYRGIDPASQDRIDAISLSANITTITEVSDSSDEESTPKKSKRFTFSDTDLPNDEEIKNCVKSKSKPEVLLSESESESSSEDEIYAGNRCTRRTNRPEPSQPSSSGGGQNKVKTQRPGLKDQAVVKRALNGTLSPRGDHKRPRLEQSKRAQAASLAQQNNLCVAITCERTGILSKDVSDQVLTAIQKQIISEAFTPEQGTPGLTFNAQPLFTEGVLKLWCGNDHTLIWLKNTVSGLSLPNSTKLVVKRQSEIQIRVCCGIVIPDEQGVFEELTDIGRTLSYQNPWVDIKRWILYNADKQTEAWFVLVGVPEDQIPILMKAGRHLSVGLGAVHVNFYCPNGSFSDVPHGWDPATGTLANQPSQLTPTLRRAKGFRPTMSSIDVPFVDV